MIATISGTVTARRERTVTIDVHGVGFSLFILPRTLDQLVVGQPATLQTHLHVREDALELYGFARAEELSLFEQLLTVSGVGPKMALGVLSAASVEDLQRAIDQGQSAVLTKVSGVGKKTAERIIVDLRGKLAEDQSAPDSSLSAVIDALMTLGYSNREAREAATHTPASGSVEERIKAALRRMG